MLSSFTSKRNRRPAWLIFKFEKTNLNRSIAIYWYYAGTNG